MTIAHEKAASRAASRRQDGCLSVQFQPTLDALQALRKIIRLHLLLCLYRCEMADVLYQRCLPRLKIGEPACHFLQLALDAVLTGLKSFQVFNDEVFDVFHGCSLLLLEKLKDCGLHGSRQGLRSGTQGQPPCRRCGALQGLWPASLHHPCPPCRPRGRVLFARQIKLHLANQRIGVFAEVHCDHGDPLLVYRAPRFRAGQQLSVARASGLCLHRSPEFFAVPLAVPGLGFGRGRVCKSEIYGFPLEKTKAPQARSWRSVGRRGEELRGTVLGAACDGQWTPRGERLKLRSKLKYWVFCCRQNAQLDLFDSGLSDGAECGTATRTLAKRGGVAGRRPA